MKKVMHLCVSCEGALRRPKDFAGAVTVNGNVLESVPEITEFFQGQLLLGHRVIPFGDCDNFDWETGCKGHEVEDEVEENNDGMDKR